MQLVNGNIPKNTECPFKSDCVFVAGCKHKGINHDIDFSCAVARALDILKERNKKG